MSKKKIIFPSELVDSIEVPKIKVGADAEITKAAIDKWNAGTKVASSSTNGNIKINDSDISVYSHPNSTVTASTYTCVTVDTQGHVTGGSNHTTLEGYGITDAIPSSAKGAANGVATLNEQGLIPATQLPSYVDDIIEGYYNSDNKLFYQESTYTTAITGESSKIYVDLSTNKTYRWGGDTSKFVVISDTITIGTTSGTALDGATGSAHINNNTGNPHNVTAAQVGLGNVVNTGDSATPVSGGTTKFTTGGAYTELNKKVDKENGKGLSTNDYTIAEKEKLAGIAANANNYTHPESHAASMITGLADVATSGSYDDLSNKPTIPAAYALPAATTDALGGVKSGGDVTITDGIISVTNYSHSHTKIPNDLSLANSDNSTYYAMTAQSYNAMSDVRLKENFKPLVPEKSILGLPTYKFDFKDGAKNQIGCKAQDLQEICPEIVNEGSDGYLSIQESKIVYLLLDEIKKLRQEVDELKGAK